MEGYKGNKTFGKFKGSLPVEVKSRDGKRDKIGTKQLNIRNKEVDRRAKQTSNFEWLGMEVNRELSRETKNPSDRRLYRAASKVNEQNIANSPSEQEFYNWVKRVERNDPYKKALRRKEEHVPAKKRTSEQSLRSSRRKWSNYKNKKK